MIRTAALYQRIKHDDSYRSQAVPMKRNRYVPDTNAASFGVRAPANGKRTIQTFQTFADALEVLNVTNHSITTEANGLEGPAISLAETKNKP